MNVLQAQVNCDRRSCFGNRCGLCKVLAEPITGKPCPFYKSEKRYKHERTAIENNDMYLYKAAEVYDRVVK